MEKKQRDEIHKKLAERRLITKLLERVNARCGEMSRANIYLAFKEGPTTPLREAILEEAENMYTEETTEIAVSA